MRKILPVVAFTLTLVVGFVFWSALKSPPDNAPLYEYIPAEASVESEVTAPDINQLRDAIASVTLVAEPSDGQVSAITVKEGEFLRIKLSPLEQGDLIWFLDDDFAPNGAHSRFLSSPSQDGSGMEFTGWHHGKGTFRTTFKFGLYPRSSERFLRREPRPFIKVFYVDITVE